jgi:hypothetical protein
LNQEEAKSNGRNFLASGFQFLITKENAHSYWIPYLYFLHPEHYGADFVKRSNENMGAVMSCSGKLLDVAPTDILQQSLTRLASSFAYFVKLMLDDLP